MGDVDTAAGSSVAPGASSSREILKGTLVPLAPVPASRGERPEAAGIAKYSAITHLDLAVGDTDAIREALQPARTRSRSDSPVSAATMRTLRQFENPAVPALRPDIDVAAKIPTTEVSAVAQALVEVRTNRLADAKRERAPDDKIAHLMASLSGAVIASKAFEINARVHPVGMLNLERLEMTPAGIERGELIATIPLAPGEETAVTHKEWSVTTKEFTSIVTDSLEEVSETGVTDNTDLSQSTTSENNHSIQFNITGTVSGGIPIINGSSTTGLTMQDAGSTSATEAVRHASQLTHKASTRSKKEHKTTISTTTVTGTSETSTRILKNTNPTLPIRIDYFSLMRKWRVRLYRYGLRLTYDVVVPQPGGPMRRAYGELAQLRALLGPLQFTLTPHEIQPGNIESHGKTYGAAVKAAPPVPAPIFATQQGAGNTDWSWLSLEFGVPPGAEIDGVFLNTLIGDNGGQVLFKVLGVPKIWVGTHHNGRQLWVNNELILDTSGAPYMAGAQGHQKCGFWMDNTSGVSVTLKVVLRNSTALMDAWRMENWHILYNAAQARHFAQQQAIANRIAEIETKLAGVDTLTLRREESDEIMRAVLRYVLGINFDFMPANVLKALMAASFDAAFGYGDDDSTLGLNPTQFALVRQHMNKIRFINQAIEWESVVTFLYSYFWDVPDAWRFIRELRHPDSTRQAFLRAGSARVVLTVRKGWEQKWLQFTDSGVVPDDSPQPKTGPYLTIAQEIAAYDDRNYPGIPPANPSKLASRPQDAVYTTSSAKVAASAANVSIEVASSAGLVAGLPVVLDGEDSRHVQEAQVIVSIPDATHIVVEKLVHPHDGTSTPFRVYQPGEKGTLIAEWNEYTPSSGTDIAVTSNLATIV